MSNYATTISPQAQYNIPYNLLSPQASNVMSNYNMASNYANMLPSSQSQTTTTGDTITDIVRKYMKMPETWGGQDAYTHLMSTPMATMLQASLDPSQLMSMLNKGWDQYQNNILNSKVPLDFGGVDLQSKVINPAQQIVGSFKNLFDAQGNAMQKLAAKAAGGGIAALTGKGGTPSWNNTFGSGTMAKVLNTIGSLYGDQVKSMEAPLAAQFQQNLQMAAQPIMSYLNTTSANAQNAFSTLSGMLSRPDQILDAGSTTTSHSNQNSTVDNWQGSGGYSSGYGGGRSQQAPQAGGFNLNPNDMPTLLNQGATTPDWVTQANSTGSPAGTIYQGNGTYYDNRTGAWNPGTWSSNENTTYDWRTGYMPTTTYDTGPGSNPSPTPGY